MKLKFSWLYRGYIGVKGSKKLVMFKPSPVLGLGLGRRALLGFKGLGSRVWPLHVVMGRNFGSL